MMKLKLKQGCKSQLPRPLRSQPMVSVRLEPELWLLWYFWTQLLSCIFIELVLLSGSARGQRWLDGMLVAILYPDGVPLLINHLEGQLLSNLALIAPGPAPATKKKYRGQQVCTMVRK